MWNEIVDENTLANFMENIDFFHDSCIKEFKYLSGAYVNEEFSMYPVNAHRILNIIIQRQSEKNPMIEMEFQEVKYFKMCPADEKHTCEILDATMILKEDCIYWCDCGDLSEADLSDYNGTVICASRLRWRSIDHCMGKKEFYLPIK